MRLPLSWLAAYADVPAGLPPADLAAALTRVGLTVEGIERPGAGVSGVVVGEVREIEELTGHKKPIRYCQVDDGTEVRGIVCGATNFVAGDRVVVALPGAVLDGGFRIEARKTYGHLSDGMICSLRELGIGEDHRGIVVLPATAPVGADPMTGLGRDSLADVVLEIEVTPDRGYCLSARGLAREAATALGTAFRDPARIDVPVADGPSYEVRVEDPAGCDRYVARTAHGLDPAARSPLWLQQRLRHAGMRPISLAVDVTNHVLLDLGQPLHAFDATRLSGPIVVRRARAGERITTLDGVDRALDPTDLVIADDGGAVAIAGVMGGERAEVGPRTTDIVIESAHFDPESVARTARRHRLASEASRRFERGVDDDVAPAAAQAAVGLLVALGGAVAGPGTTDVDARVARPAITLPVDLPGRIAGVEYGAATVRARLVDVGCAVTGEDVLAVVPPSWRPDLVAPYDLVEEVARLHGYDAIPALLPRAPAGRGLTAAQRARRGVGRALAAAGFVEAVAPPFTAPVIADRMGVVAADRRRAAVRVANPLSDEESVLRTTLLPGLLAALRRNVGRGVTDVALFEQGSVFLATGGAQAPRLPVSRAPSADEVAALEAALPDQPRHVAAVLAGDRVPAGWNGPARAATWADAVAAARAVADAVGGGLVVRRGDCPPWHPGRCAELTCDGHPVGYAGELHPRAAAAFDVPARTCAMELDLGMLLDGASRAGPAGAPAVSTFPPATQDVALVVDDGVLAADVEAALRDGAGPLLEAVRLFDVYTGAQVGAGKRSLAYALRLRAPDRTLTAEEASTARDAAVAEAHRRTGATLRG